MARIYKSKNVLENQQVFLKLLSDYEIEIFSSEKIESLINTKFNNINSIISNLTDKGFLTKIEKGKYCFPTFRKEHVIGTKMVKNGCIAYWTALNLHGLTEQFSNTIFIQSAFQKKDKTVFGIHYKFIKVNSCKIAGIEESGTGNHKFNITNPLKTIVDCFDLPQYSGGFPELVRAISKVEIDQDKMISYCEKINNISAIKRIAFLLQYQGKKGIIRFIGFAQSKVNEKYNLLDPYGPNTGKHDNLWRLRINIEPEKLNRILNNPY